MDDESIEFLKVISNYNFSWPSIGKFLDFYYKLSEVHNYNSDEYEKTQKKVRRLVLEKEVNLEEYEEILKKVVTNLESFTNNKARHWLSGGAFIQIFTSYQWLIRNVNCYPADNQSLIDHTFFSVFIRWSMEQYFKYLRDDLGEVLYREDLLWFLPDDEKVSSSKNLMKRVCALLNIKKITAYSLATRYVPNAESDGIERTMQEWFSGKTFPKFESFSEYVVKKVDCPIKKGDLKVLYIEASWGNQLQEWLIKKSIKIDGQMKKNIQDIATDVFSRPKFSATRLPVSYHKSSDDFIEIREICSCIQIFKNCDEDEAHSILIRLQELQRKIANEGTLEDIIMLAEHGRYFLGAVAEKALEDVYDKLLLANDEQIAKFHKYLFIRGFFTEKSVNSRNWRDYKKNPIFKRSKIQDSNNCYVFVKSNFNPVYYKKKFAFSKLCKAVQNMDFTLVTSMLKSGDDPFYISRDRNKSFGEGSNVLLYSIWGNEHPLEEQLKMWNLLFSWMKKIDRTGERLKEAVNFRTTVEGISPFSQAIFLGEYDLVKDCVDAKADPQAPVGSDDESPLYFSLGIHLNVLLRDQGQLENYIKNSSTNVNISRMPEYLSEVEISIINREIKKNNIDLINSIIPEKTTSENTRRIIELLISEAFGADPNQVQRHNGWYPLDLAMEILLRTGEAYSIFLLLEKGAKKTVNF